MNEDKKLEFLYWTPSNHLKTSPADGAATGLANAKPAHAPELYRNASALAQTAMSSQKPASVKTFVVRAVESAFTMLEDASEWAGVAISFFAIGYVTSALVLWGLK